MTAAPTWPVRGTSLRARMEAALRSAFSAERLAQLSCDRFARIAGASESARDHASSAKGTHASRSARHRLVCTALGLPCGAWGAPQCSSVLWRAASDESRFSGSSRRSDFVFVSVWRQGAEPKWRQLTNAVAMFNTLSHARTVDEVAALALLVVGWDTLASTARRAGAVAAEVLPRSAFRQRRKLTALREDPT